MRILVRNVLLVALLSGILFFLLEGGVRLLAPQQARMEMLGGESLAVKDSVLGHRLRPGAVAVDHAIEFTARYAINEQGLRDDAVYSAHKSDGRPRFLLLGDSFAFGVGSDYKHSRRRVFRRPARLSRAGMARPGADSLVPRQ